MRSRRGEVALHVRRDDGTPRGAVFVPFAYYEAAANLMTNAALDPFGKIPEFKYCAIQVRRRRHGAAQPGYGTGGAEGRAGEPTQRPIAPAPLRPSSARRADC